MGLERPRFSREFELRILEGTGQCGIRVKDLSLGDLSVDTQLYVFFLILFIIAKLWD